MSDLLAIVTVIAFVGMCIGAVVAWGAVLIFGIKAVRCARPGVELWGRETLWNPANALLRPSLLTEEGRAYHRKWLLAIGVFVGCVGIPLVVAALTGNLD